MELKPCPFCGSKKVKLIESLVAKSVSCYDCGGSGAYNVDKLKAIKAWNTRADGWISVEDRLPKKNTLVLAINSLEGIYTSIFNEKGWGVSGYGYMKNITHWMPLPEPPDTRKEE
jgi:Lar family restriction alleviation protein